MLFRSKPEGVAGKVIAFPQFEAELSSNEVPASPGSDARPPSNEASASREQKDDSSWNTTGSASLFQKQSEDLQAEIETLKALIAKALVPLPRLKPEEAQQKYEKHMKAIEARSKLMGQAGYIEDLERKTEKERFKEEMIMKYQVKKDYVLDDLLNQLFEAERPLVVHNEPKLVEAVACGFQASKRVAGERSSYRPVCDPVMLAAHIISGQLELEWTGLDTSMPLWLQSASQDYSRTIEPFANKLLDSVYLLFAKPLASPALAGMHSLSMSTFPYEQTFTAQLAADLHERLIQERLNVSDKAQVAFEQALKDAHEAATSIEGRRKLNQAFDWPNQKDPDEEQEITLIRQRIRQRIEEGLPYQEQMAPSLVEDQEDAHMSAVKIVPGAVSQLVKEEAKRGLIS